MKRNKINEIISVLLIAAIAMTLTSCGGDEPNEAKETLTGTVYTIETGKIPYTAMPTQTTFQCSHCGEETEHFHVGVKDCKSNDGFYWCDQCHEMEEIAFGNDAFATECTKELNGCTQAINVTCKKCGEETLHYCTGAYDATGNVNYMCSECYAIETYNVGKTTLLKTKNYSSHPLSVEYDCLICGDKTTFYFTGAFDANGGNYQCETCHGIRVLKAGVS